MASIRITEGELIEALFKAAPEAPKNAKTTKEFAQLTGQSRDQIERVIGRLAMMDRIAVHRVQRLAIDGTPRWVPAYSILPSKKRKS